MKARIRSAIRLFLPMACVWSLAAAMVVLTQHHVLRLEANDPQVQLAEDAARRLADGADPKSVLPAGPIALEHSLAPFVAVYDSAGAPLASSATLRGAAPRLPAGVLEHALRHGGHRLSWQPRPGLRQALVIVPLRTGPAGYVVAGRSLREAEARKLQVLEVGRWLWLAGLGACLLLAMLLALLTPPRS